MEKREIYMVSSPLIWDYELFYLTYNDRTNKIEFNGKELNDNLYNLDDIIIMWDGKDRDYYFAHPKRYVDVYRSNSDKPEKGYTFVGKEYNGDLKYYYKRKESYDMLITKYYIIFGTNNVELDRQLEKIVQEFDCAKWKIRRSERGVQYPWAIATKENTKIVIKSCIPYNHDILKWDNCWISNHIDRETIDNVIIPMANNDTPEIHFF